MMTKKAKHAIQMNLVNSALAGALVLAGSFTTGEISLQGISAALAASGVVFLTKFQTFWGKMMRKTGGQTSLFSFME